MPASVLTMYNSLTRRHEAFVPADPSRVTFYSCGPTVYDDAHIGNFRTFLAGDVLRRWIESPLCVLRGADGVERPGPRAVLHVMNITDVGHMTDDASADGGGQDKMAAAGQRLLEAKKKGSLSAGFTGDPRNPYDIASYYAGRFIEDARRLGLRVAGESGSRPVMPRATENVGGMVRVIERLIARGHAYAVGPAGAQAVYFDVRSFPGYGRLSGNTLDALREGEGGRVSAEHQAQKRHPADFLLWKSDPSHVMKWPSPWGEGYPGWHIECTVMSARVLLGLRGPGDAPTPEALDRALGAALENPAPGPAIIDIHSGGEDNIFPHHECEIAQSCAAFNADDREGTFARLWFHARHLMVDGKKMSKSAGTFHTARDLFAKGHEPGALRLELIKTHYRSNANFTEQGLKDSARTLERWRRFQDEAARGPAGPGDPDVAGELAGCLHDDLNVAGAIGVINSWMSRRPTPTAGDAALLRAFDAILGVLELERAASAQTEIGLFAPGVTPDERVVRKLLERAAARASKDFARSDAIRDELLAMGYAIKDVAGGRVEVRRA